MKITVSQLRKIIREEVERNLSEAKLKVGDKVEEKGTDSGWWEVLELIPDNRTGKTVAKLQMFQPVGGRKPITHVTTDKLSKVRESLDYKKQGWPDCSKPGCTGKMKPNPHTGNKTSLYCSKCGAEKKKAIKLENTDFSDYIRDVDRDMPTSWDSPDPQDV
jgi:hypothetical protein